MPDTPPPRQISGIFAVGTIREAGRLTLGLVPPSIEGDVEHGLISGWKIDGAHYHVVLEVGPWSVDLELDRDGDRLAVSGWLMRGEDDSVEASLVITQGARHDLLDGPEKRGDRTFRLERGAARLLVGPASGTRYAVEIDLV